MAAVATSFCYTVCKRTYVLEIREPQVLVKVIHALRGDIFTKEVPLADIKGLKSRLSHATVPLALNLLLRAKHLPLEQFSLFSDQPIKKSPEEMVEIIQEAAGESFVVHHQLGYAWLFGLGGVHKSRERAQGWFQKAADRGYAVAQAVLGALLSDQKQTAQARELFEKAAAGGYTVAYCLLGKSYFDDPTVPGAKAIEYFEKAIAEGGDVVAECALGEIYRQGLREIPQSYEKALAYFQRSAAHGYLHAQACLESLK